MVKRALLTLAISSMVASFFAVLPAVASTDVLTRDVQSSGNTSLSMGTGQPPAATEEGTTGEESLTSPAADGRHVGSTQESGSGQTDESGRDASTPNLRVSFDGLNHFNQRTANGGNQGSVEPPDQGLCAGNGFVLEVVNDVMAVYRHNGQRLVGPVDLNTFFGYPAAINRATGKRGPLISDPSCYFDRATERWFQVVRTQDLNPNNGAPLRTNRLEVAVSKTPSPIGAWTIYRIAAQDDGTQGTPNHNCPGGPCGPDYPHIGADAHGFYISSNEYSLFAHAFHAAQIYAFSKRALAANLASVRLSQIDTKGMVRGSQPGFTVWPAQAGRDLHTGTEFFLSSNSAEEVNSTGSSTDLIVWALSNTRSLGSHDPDLSLTNTVVTVGRYSVPTPAHQKTGSTPLRDCINDTVTQCWRMFFPPSREPGHNEISEVVDTNDTRMQQVTFAHGLLFGALDTAVTVNGKSQAGIEWFAVRPHVSAHGVQAQVAREGYVARAETSLTFPALTVSEEGMGAMAFSLLGTNDYPSAAYALFDWRSGVGPIHIAKTGAGPDDGAFGYAAFAGAHPVGRWGDYGAAVVDGSSIWLASEYIGQTCALAQYLTDPTCGGSRTQTANWATRISQIGIGD